MPSLTRTYTLTHYAVSATGIQVTLVEASPPDPTSPARQQVTLPYTPAVAKLLAEKIGSTVVDTLEL